MSIENMEAWHSTLTELENVKEIVDKHLKPRISELEKENDALQKKLDDMRERAKVLVEFLDHLYREVLEGDESKLAKEILEAYRKE